MLNIFFTPIFYWCVFFYSNIVLKLDFGYNIFVFEVIMFLFSNFFLLVRFLHQFFTVVFFYTNIILKLDSREVVLVSVVAVPRIVIFFHCSD